MAINPRYRPARVFLAVLMIVCIVAMMIVGTVIPAHAVGGAALLAAFGESASVIVAAHPVAAVILVTVAIGAGIGGASNWSALEGLAQDMLNSIPAGLLSVLDGMRDLAVAGSFSVASLIAAGATDLMTWFISWVSGLGAEDNVPITYDLGNGQLWKGKDLKADLPMGEYLTYRIYDAGGPYWCDMYLCRVSNYVVEIGIKFGNTHNGSNLFVDGYGEYHSDTAYGTNRPYDVGYRFVGNTVEIYGYVCGLSLSASYTADLLMDAGLQAWDTDHVNALFGHAVAGTVLPQTTYFPTSDTGQGLTTDQPLTIPQDVQSAVGATAPDVRGDRDDPIVPPIDPPITGEGSGTISGAGGGTGVFEGSGSWVLNIPVLGDILKALQSLLSTIASFFDVSQFDLDFSPLKLQLSTVFPFCIPFDFLRLVKNFAVSPTDFQFDIRLNTTYFKIDHTVDLAPFRLPIMFFRYIVVAWFGYILLVKTRDFMKW